MRVIDLQSISIATYLDQMRSAVLRLTMKNGLLRQIYRDRSARLSFNYIFLSVIYLFVSLKWSTVLLILGPLVLGYPHLVASYRFVQSSTSGLKLRWAAHRVFRFFIFLTATSLLIRFVLPQLINIPPLPYGTWEVLLSLLVLPLVKLKTNSLFDVSVAVMTLLMTVGVLAIANHDPMAFVGFALILHNWVAFGHWFLSAKDSKNKLVAIMAIVVFALIHFVVLSGYFDAWISFPEITFLSSRSFEIKGWAIAPWTTDPMVWSRVIILYVFGLSMHYFVWLQAIPQCLDQKSVPNSFRNTFQQLRKDCGPKTTSALLAAGVIVAIAMWFHTALAGRIYFGIAMLHGWLELVFLMIAFSVSLLGLLRRNKKPDYF